MDRKEFLKGAATGLCACAAACFPVAAETPQTTDWRFGFVQRRYTKLISMLSETMSDAELQRTLIQLGSYCSSEGDQVLDRYKGDVEGFAAQSRTSSSGDSVTYDRDRQVVTMTSPDRTDCFCPLNSVKAKTPGMVCNCSLGWQKHTWEKILQKKVRVELKEAVLRGDKRCTFEIHILPA